MGLIRRIKDAPQFTAPFSPILHADIVADKTVNVIQRETFPQKIGMVVIPDL